LDKSPGDSLLFKQSALRGVSYALTFDPTIPPKFLIDEMPALSEFRADGGGRIARRHFGMAEEFGALSLSPPAHFVEDIERFGMVGRICEPDHAFIGAGLYRAHRGLARRVGASAAPA